MDGNETATSNRRPGKAPQPLVARPVREQFGPSDPKNFGAALNSIAAKFPSLKRELSQSEMNFTPAGFVGWAVKAAILASIVLMSIAFIVLKNNPVLPMAIVLGFPVFVGLMFIYFMNFPRVRARMRAKNIDSELVFAGRHMLIELKSGVALFDAMLGVSRDYGVVSQEFNKIVEKVTLGVPMSVALHSVAENNPSQYFNRLILQMANSIASGSDVATALESSLEQISREQVIELKAYGQKLNPIAMFFMVFGIILPSLGVAFLIIVLSFLGNSGIQLNFSALMLILACIGIFQFIFLTAIESQRPKFDIGV
jgi:pilus assembly protein TadC